MPFQRRWPKRSSRAGSSPAPVSTCPMGLSRSRPSSRTNSFVSCGLRMAGVSAGRASRVPWGASAHHIVAAGDVDGQVTIALVAGGRARVTTDRNVALEPRDTLDFDDTPVEAAAPAASGLAARTPSGSTARWRVRRRWPERCNRFWRSRSATRPNASSSAGPSAPSRPSSISSPCWPATQRPRAWRLPMRAGRPSAATRHGRSPPPRFVWARPPGSGPESRTRTHGAIGFTYEHSLHFATRRLWSWRAEFGAESHWAAALGRCVAERGADQLWPDLTAP